MRLKRKDNMIRTPVAAFGIAAAAIAFAPLLVTAPVSSATAPCYGSNSQACQDCIDANSLKAAASIPARLFSFSGEGQVK
jgi:hypothetical protein